MPQVQVQIGAVEHWLQVQRTDVSAEGVSITYTLSPPVEVGVDPGQVLPFVTAVDEAGTSYTDGGGFLGTPQGEGGASQGTVSLRPSTSVGTTLAVTWTFLSEGREFSAVLPIALT